jgi:hypothetical protein
VHSISLARSGSGAVLEPAPGDRCLLSFVFPTERNLICAIGLTMLQNAEEAESLFHILITLKAIVSTTTEQQHRGVWNLIYKASTACLLFT